VCGPCQGFTVDGSRKTKKVDEGKRPNKREKKTITVKRYITLPAYFDVAWYLALMERGVLSERIMFCTSLAG
jgi:HSP20 family molecular chaperone IbpA